jgi:DNA-binding CsgD family transcriptional regulator
MMPAAHSCGAGHPARLLADALTALKRLGVTDRTVFDRILRCTLERNPNYLGFWSVWEPNALDGLDDEYVNHQGHDDTGRYIPFWNRSHGQINLEPNVFYETPGVGEFYLRPRRERRETAIEPYEYPVAGERRLIATQGAPIMLDGRCVGVAGFDIAVEDIPGAAATSGDNPLEAVMGGSCITLRPGNEGGKLAYCSSRSRELLERYVGPVRRGELPTALQRALEARGTRTSCCNGDGGSPLDFRLPGSELLVHAFEHCATGPGLWLLERSVADPGRDLSAREREVLDWLSAGKTNAEIATILGISVHTVKRHVEKVLQKLEVPNRAAATARAIDRGAQA